MVLFSGKHTQAGAIPYTQKGIITHQCFPAVYRSLLLFHKNTTKLNTEEIKEYRSSSKLMLYNSALTRGSCPFALSDPAFIAPSTAFWYLYLRNWHHNIISSEKPAIQNYPEKKKKKKKKWSQWVSVHSDNHQCLCGNGNWNGNGGKIINHIVEESGVAPKK
jgi:hypothetical protein